MSFGTSGKFTCAVSGHVLDTLVFLQVQNLERAYFKMWNLYCSGSHPQPFKVHEDDAEFPFDR
jgi:hypothetical protein